MKTIKIHSNNRKKKVDKIKAYERLESLKRISSINIDLGKERKEIMNEKYGDID